MPSGERWTEADQIRVLKLLREDASRQRIAQQLGYHRDTITTMIDQAALSFLALAESGNLVATE